jgi:hypothetical protein
MLSQDLAVAVSVEIVRVFVRLRKLLDSHDGLARNLAHLEKKMTDHDEMSPVPGVNLDCLAPVTGATMPR